ncbi:uncharacterized protein LOC132947753 [Metopolophium dirhodum]|uniref:uncharacterized protein LOC132947753 n=1 Tax=Metopolophium dirhodum TaxID=44670 RepID=UPI00298FF2AF|nr:uncharacterized protein LOC132947753 [Metopolophium dirhodum]
MKCTRCDSNQHRWGRCPDREAETSLNRQSANYVNSTAIRNSGNLYTKTVIINDTSVNGIVDTSSTNVLLRESVACRAGVTYQRTSRPLYAVGDANQPSTITIGEAKVDVDIDGVLAADHEVRIVSDDALPVDVLVGQTWLQLPHVHFYKCGSELIFEANAGLETTDCSVTDYDNTCSYVAEVRAPKPRETITVDDVRIDTSVTAEQRDELMTLMNRYRDVFAKTLDELGCTDVVKMEIVETPDSASVSAKAYRSSPSDRRLISNILLEWKSAGIISDSTSSYASPVLLVNKASGERDSVWTPVS